MNRILIYLLLLLTFNVSSQGIDEYYEALRKYGQEPLSFVEERLDEYDLIVFDDGLHSAYEPFKFYKQLLEKKKGNIDFVFIEVFSIKHQTHLNNYFESEIKDSTLLLKVFQNDMSGYGWKYETYYELLSKVWDINSTLEQEDKIKVVGVNQPIYWESIKTREDYDVFLKSLVGRDYFMYKVIMEFMKEFEDDKKGIFLTNTRHAYKNVKNQKGNLYWNCGTFLNQWHPNKSYSVRIHNVQLSIEERVDNIIDKSAEGLGRYKYNWVQMEDGLWDRVFERNNNKPIAIPFKENIFGRVRYIGNHMLNVAKNQTMYDAYDALVFIAPLDSLHFSAQIDFIYTEAFKKELERRILLLHENSVEELFKRSEVTTIESYVNKISKYKPVTKNQMLIKNE